MRGLCVASEGSGCAVIEYVRHTMLMHPNGFQRYWPFLAESGRIRPNQKGQNLYRHTKGGVRLGLQAAIPLRGRIRISLSWDFRGGK